VKQLQNVANLLAIDVREFKKCVILITIIMVSVNHVQVKLIKTASMLYSQHITELLNVKMFVLSSTGRAPGMK